MAKVVGNRHSTIRPGAWPARSSRVRRRRTTAMGSRYPSARSIVSMRSASRSRVIRAPLSAACQASERAATARMGRCSMALQRRDRFETFIAQAPAKLLKPEAHLRRRFERPRRVHGFAVTAELESHIACFGPHIAEQRLDRREIPGRGEADRPRPDSDVAQKLARIARINIDQWTSRARVRNKQFEFCGSDGLEKDILDAQT